MVFMFLVIAIAAVLQIALISIFIGELCIEFVLLYNRGLVRFALLIIRRPIIQTHIRSGHLLLKSLCSVF
jgi:hypothetical protein